MKKLLSLILVIVLVLSLSVPAFADTVGNDTNEYKASGSTKITTSMGPHYTLVIPAETNIEWGATSTRLGKENGVYGIDAAPDASRLEAGKVVSITLDMDDLKNAANETIAYTLSNAGYKATIDAPTTSVNVNITEAVWNAAKAGTYEGLVNFTAEYVDGTAGVITA